ncbi:hypothetical protein Syun_009915 [Stephania yunnanensis]|uniref:cellulase n=1 Tax=Stephania yunnanensis TaxID=152371 RepID=A0AAP0KFF7_9MAGN
MPSSQSTGVKLEPTTVSVCERCMKEKARGGRVAEEESHGGSEIEALHESVVPFMPVHRGVARADGDVGVQVSTGAKLELTVTVCEQRWMKTKDGVGEVAEDESHDSNEMDLDGDDDEEWPECGESPWVGDSRWMENESQNFSSEEFQAENPRPVINGDGDENCIPRPKPATRAHPVDIFVTSCEAPTVTMNLGIHHPLVEFIYQELFNNGVEIVWNPPPRRHSLNIFTYHINYVWTQDDICGCYYDAGDNAKFGLPMAFTITMMSWSIVEYGKQMAANGELEHAMEAVKWGNDGSGAVLFQPAKEFLPTIQEIIDELEGKTKCIYGVILENNRFCISVHFRRVREEVVDGKFSEHMICTCFSNICAKRALRIFG